MLIPNNHEQIIYQPKGKAKEYSPWAANFYNGCSNKCDYCYNRHCQAKALLGKDVPTLKKGLTEANVTHVFYDELMKYKEQIIADGKGLFFNFVSDPFLPETICVNLTCLEMAVTNDVPCVVLTKQANWFDAFMQSMFMCGLYGKMKQMVKFGFTLTGCDELEHGASTNADRIILMKDLHESGFKTWASIEPVIDIKKSLLVMAAADQYCDEFKIGLLSGKKNYSKEDVCMMAFQEISRLIPFNKIQYKDSVYEYIKDILPNFRITSYDDFVKACEVYYDAYRKPVIKK